MNIAIVGIGGIGAYIGSKLCKHFATSNEHRIVFIQRGEHFNAIAQHGLTYITKQESVVYPHFITDKPETDGMFDLVIFALKSKDLEQAALSVKNNLHKKTVLLTTLNGVNNAARLQAIFPNHKILNGCIYVSASIERPGVVRQIGGAGNLFFGPIDGDIAPFVAIEELLKQAEIKAVLTPNIKQDVWEKYIFICSWASISSKYRMSVGALLENESIVAEWSQLITEIKLIATKHQVEFSSNIVQECIDRARQLPYGNKTSMLIDIEAGKIPEIDIFTEYIVSEGKRLGVATPAHDDVLTHILKTIKP